jgi:membrane protease YdiL (CAAX protease family)
MSTAAHRDPNRIDWKWMVAIAIGGLMFSVVAMAFATYAVMVVRRRGGVSVTDPEVQLVSSAAFSLGLVATAFFAPLVRGTRARATLGLEPPPKKALLLAPIGMLALGPTSDLLVRVAKHVVPNATLGNLEILDDLSKQAPLVALFVVFAILPGLAEELYFRGLVQRAIVRPRVALAVSTVAFAALHADPHHVIGVLPLGLYLAWVAARTGSTWATILAHTVNNALALLGARFVPDWNTPDLDATSFALSGGGLVITAAVVAALNRLPVNDRPAGMSAFLPLAKRLEAVQPSATVAISQRARDLQAQGIDVLSFSVGEPDFDTPKHIVEAAKKAADEGATRYTAVRGIPPLLKAICETSKKRRKVAHDPAEVVVSVGAKHTLYNLSIALFNPGDEVIVPGPYWVSYPEQA